MKNKFFTPTSARVSSRLNKYMKENFGYEVDGEIEELRNAKIELQAMIDNNNGNLVETTLMLHTVDALIKAHSDQIAEAKAKPDFLDVDKDGNKKEPMKKALKDKKKVNEVDMGQAKSAQDKKDEAGSKKGKYNVVNGKGKVVSSHDNHGDAIRAANKNDDHKVKKVNESVSLQVMLMNELNALLESDAATAEITMAARGIVDELQDVIEKLGKIQNDQLGPLVDEMTYTHGGEQAQSFRASVDEAIGGLLDQTRSAKDSVNSAVLVLTGEQPAADTMGPSDDELGGDMTDDFEDDVEADMGDDMEADFTDGDEANSGPAEEPLGRARR